ncbi:MAG: ABC transporter ATP-binding protein [Omnitrophica WOR_2 bacterium GWA2_47_8]|nr:MAG: ABC transporter ATP-binding protein [Omnitrophica WOR_2 bacterium GWA2_47_8]
MIKVQGLYKSFNGQAVLNDINLYVPEGEILAILGESGSGKSVFLQHLIGLLKPDRGTIEIDGTDITKLSEEQLLKLRAKIGYLFQEGALYDFFTVYENVAFPLMEHTRMKSKEITQKVEHMLHLVGLEKAAYKYPSELSGGMKKRAALARSVILDSKFLLCDEPTSGLDPLRSRQIMDLIANLTPELKCTTIITSHDIPNSFRVADRVAIIKEGHIIAIGTREELELSRDNSIQELLKV